MTWRWSHSTTIWTGRTRWHEEPPSDEHHHVTLNEFHEPQSLLKLGLRYCRKFHQVRLSRRQATNVSLFRKTSVLFFVTKPGDGRDDHARQSFVLTPTRQTETLRECNCCQEYVLAQTPTDTKRGNTCIHITSSYFYPSYHTRSSILTNVYII